MYVCMCVCMYVRMCACTLMYECCMCMYAIHNKHMYVQGRIQKFWKGEPPCEGQISVFLASGTKIQGLKVSYLKKNSGGGGAPLPKSASVCAHVH